MLGGRLNVVTPVHHLSEDSHINCPLRAGPITASSLALESGYDFHMCGVTELVDRRHRGEPIAGIDQNSRIAREGRE